MRSTQESGQILRSKKRPRRTLRSGRGSRTNSNTSRQIPARVIDAAYDTLPAAGFCADLRKRSVFGCPPRIRHGEGHVEDARERLRQQSLARAGRADQQDVRLRELDVVVLGLVLETLVVIMDRDREHLLGVILTDDIVVKNFAYLLRGRNAVARLHQGGFILLADDVHAQFDALLADENGRAGDELAHLVLAFAAERAVERILGFAAADLAHLRTPTRYKSSQP